MSKLKKMLAVISAVGLLSVSTGSIANDNLGQKSFDSTPAFLQNTGAVMMTDGQMAKTRGEFVCFGVCMATVAFLVVRGIPFALAVGRVLSSGKFIGNSIWNERYNILNDLKSLLSRNYYRY